jgi:hypothetical protein
MKLSKAESSRRNAVKAGHVTSHIVRRKKDGLTHEEAKREAHIKFRVKTSKYRVLGAWLPS